MRNGTLETIRQICLRSKLLTLINACRLPVKTISVSLRKMIDLSALVKSKCVSYVNFLAHTGKFLMHQALKQPKK